MLVKFLYRSCVESSVFCAYCTRSTGFLIWCRVNRVEHLQQQTDYIGSAGNCWALQLWPWSLWSCPDGSESARHWKRGVGTVFTHTPTHILNVLQVYKSATDAAGNQSGPNEPIVDAGLVFALFFYFPFSYIDIDGHLFVQSAARWLSWKPDWVHEGLFRFRMLKYPTLRSCRLSVFALPR